MIFTGTFCAIIAILLDITHGFQRYSPIETRGILRNAGKHYRSRLVRNGDSAVNLEGKSWFRLSSGESQVPDSTKDGETNVPEGNESLNLAASENRQENVAEEGDGISSNTNDGLDSGVSIPNLELCDEVGTSFMKYALSIILGRALPDARDGLKVVHRRILWAMHALKLGGSTAYRKCAKVVGDVLGNYHPHSDKSVYDALCRLSQDFIMRVPLIDGHGNFGSADDPPAAMRYTECRLSHFSEKLMLEDIHNNTVDFVPNFDSTEMEPTALPSCVPSLLINGSSGIAVGLATNVPPHNPHEIISAAILMAKNAGNVDIDTLLDVVKGPDFPTGGIIKTGMDALKKLYTTGKGTLSIEAKFTFEEKFASKGTKEVVNSFDSLDELSFSPGTRISIVITEIPYNVKMTDIIMSMTKAIKEGKMLGISDIRDESDRNGVRLVIELKRQITTPIEVEDILKQLKSQTELSSFFKCNFIALDKNGTKPIRFTLHSYLKIWLDFRVETVKRRTRYLLEKAKNSLHLTRGFIIVIDYIDDIIKMIKECSSIQQVRENLAKQEYGSLSPQQITAVLKMTLSQLSRLEHDRFLQEQEKLNNIISNYQTLLLDDSNIYSLIANELEEIQKNYKNLYHSKKRYTSILVGSKPAIHTLMDDQAISKPQESTLDSSLIVVNNHGWVQRIKLDKSFHISQKSRSIYSSRVYEPPSALHSLNSESKTVCSNLKVFHSICYPDDMCMVVCKNGFCSMFPVEKLRLCKRGYPLWKMLSMDVDEEIVLLTTVNSIKDYLVVGFEDGNVGIYKSEFITRKRKVNDMRKLKLWKRERAPPIFALFGHSSSNLLIGKYYV
ncbi:DNA gyrase subunit A, putative [Theileria equi strain WA]|uniref:DNA gyrase subunit A, putative n=1 Tax=Theileria equi strain WA TaxID=1537102 RepID=L0AX56_THEEQ|nr:DNA gyrase subunit A, putative [Theileria equi strain WA]AFZ79833.1 DNA gyrase subunit A, putative [Theileria equi strain WA]|eukprot:XP_004829499.1 DNA gyrase subunit A, putative [Theileria equi strain WA]